MSYVVLARKYRSQNFSQMVGQGHVVRALSNALSSGRLHHAYLFTGTRGIGKTTVSRILAKALNCLGLDGQGGVTAEPCGQCTACQDIDAGRYVDYTELDAASNRGVDEIQALLEQAVYKPVIGRYKVFMIDEVHMLSNTAFNAMLKTLEEPPEYLKFVLATTDPQKVPPTVLSRCLQFNLRSMAPDTVFEHLQHVLAAEKITAQDGALRLLSRAARGSMRDALSLTDQAIAFGAGEISTEGVRQMLGSVDGSHVHAMLKALGDADGAGVFAACENLRQCGMAAASALDELVGALQRMALIQLAGQTASDEDAPLVPLAKAMAPDITQVLYSLCLHGRQELTLAPDEYAGLTMLLLRMLAFQPQRAPNLSLGGGAVEAPKKPDSTPRPVPDGPVIVAAVPQARANSAPVPGGSKNEGNSGLASDFKHFVATDCIADLVQPTPGPVAPPPPADAELSALWERHVLDLSQSNDIAALIKELAMQAQWLSTEQHSDATVWHLQCASASLANGPAKDRLEAAIVARGWAQRINVTVGPAHDTPAQRATAAAAAAQAGAHAAALADPDVQHWMRKFGAKIVPGTLKPHTLPST